MGRRTLATWARLKSGLGIGPVSRWFFAAGLWGAWVLLSPCLAQEEEAADSAQLSRVIAQLQQTPTGRKLLEKAVQNWGFHSYDELSGRLRWGPASKTDAVLIRHYDAETGKETRERRVTIVLRGGQPEEGMLLDLAHELVHATSQPPWDPYDPDLTAGKYIHEAIEGVGGEVDAVQTECQVHLEQTKIEDSRASFNPKADPKADPEAESRCRHYVGKNAQERIRHDFYRVGTFRGGLLAKLGKESILFPELSNEPPALYSSTGGAPYPVALWEEFWQITHAACDNSRKRVEGASESKGNVELSDSDRETLRFILRRCPSIAKTLQANGS